MDEILIGYSVRSCTRPDAGDQQSDETIAIRPLESPSVDANVWNIPDTSGGNDQQAHLLGTGWMRGLWNNLDELANQLAQWAAFSQLPAHLIAVTWMTDQEELELGYRWGLCPREWQCDPPAISPKWELIGYDIATPSLVDCLKGTWPQMVEPLSIKTESISLNQCGLFPSSEHALSYVDLLEQEYDDPEPNFVFGIYDINRIHTW
jgi:hypothetical protein